MVKIYTTDTCPKCKMLKKKMEAKGIEYVECTDLNIMKALGFNSVPQIEIVMDYSEANEWIDEQ